MIEIYPNLFVGSAADLIHADNGVGGVNAGWFVISAARDPWHRELLGYTGRGAPKDHPEYLIAERDRRLILNLVDAPDPAYIRNEIVTAAMDRIDAEFEVGNNVLLHCNQGNSRAPTLALLWLRFHCKTTSPFLRLMSYDDAAKAFRDLYPTFEPGNGMEGYARAAWEEAAP